jgi:hypothetical protein
VPTCAPMSRINVCARRRTNTRTVHICSPCTLRCSRARQIAFATCRGPAAARALRQELHPRASAAISDSITLAGWALRGCATGRWFCPDHCRSLLCLPCTYFGNDCIAAYYMRTWQSSNHKPGCRAARHKVPINWRLSCKIIQTNVAGGVHMIPSQDVKSHFLHLDTLLHVHAHIADCLPRGRCALIRGAGAPLCACALGHSKQLHYYRYSVRSLCTE